jgi:hypothetical protein
MHPAYYFKSAVDASLGRKTYFDRIPRRVGKWEGPYPAGSSESVGKIVSYDTSSGIYSIKIQKIASGPSFSDTGSTINAYDVYTLNGDIPVAQQRLDVGSLVVLLWQDGQYICDSFWDRKVDKRFYCIQTDIDKVLVADGSLVLPDGLTRQDISSDEYTITETSYIIVQFDMTGGWTIEVVTALPSKIHFPLCKVEMTSGEITRLELMHAGGDIILPSSFAVQLTSDGGSAGDNATYCSFTYTMTVMGEEIASGVSPEFSRARILMAECAEASNGVAYWTTGFVPGLWECDETINQTNCE